MEQKRCKKCGKPLPDGYKKKKCEHCINQDKDTAQVVAGTLVALAVAVFTGKKIPPINKK